MKIKSTNTLQIASILFASIFLIFLSLVKADTYIKYPVSYIFSPIAFYSSRAGNGVRRYFEFIPKVSTYLSDYDELKTQIMDLQNENINAKKIIEENISLKNQLKLGNRSWNLEKGEITSISEDSNTIYIDRGTDDGVNEGSSVVLGNTLIGFVGSSSKNGSKITLLNSSGTYLKVSIVSGLSENINAASIKKQVSGVKQVSAVLIGNGLKMSLENISVKGQVRNGDTIVTNDSRVSQPLIIGKVSDLENNPSSTTLTSSIDTSYSMDSIKFVYVIKQ